MATRVNITNQIDADGSFDMVSQKITNIATPTNDSDASTKAYADTKTAKTTTLTVNGTANQVIVSPAGALQLDNNRTWTLSLPQDIATTSSPTFARIGVGTSPSTERVHVHDSADVAVAVYTSNANAYSARIKFIHSIGWQVESLYNNANGNGLYDFGINYARSTSPNYCGNFYVSNNGTKNFIVTPGGNVGIGTTTPAKKLDVVGTAGISDTLTLSKATGTGLSVSAGIVNSVLTANRPVKTDANKQLVSTTAGAIIVVDNTITKTDNGDTVSLALSANTAADIARGAAVYDTAHRLIVFSVDGTTKTENRADITIDVRIDESTNVTEATMITFWICTDSSGEPKAVTKGTITALSTGGLVEPIAFGTTETTAATARIYRAVTNASGRVKIKLETGCAATSANYYVNACIAGKMFMSTGISLYTAD